MDTLHIVLGMVALAAIGGMVALLMQRGALGARAAAAVESQRNAEERRADAERAVEATVAEHRATQVQLSSAVAECARLSEAVRSAEKSLAEAVEAERRLAEQKIGDVGRIYAERLSAAERAEARLKEIGENAKLVFGELAKNALNQSTDRFLQMAEQKLTSKTAEAAAEMDKRRDAVEKLVKPIADTLQKTDEKLQAMEHARTTAYAGLVEQVHAMKSEGAALRGETARLVRALREPHIRGRYGEIQLKRVAELAGLRSYCDFAEQGSVTGDDGTIKRPDMIIKLPNGRELVVDAKANLKPFLDAHEAQTPEEAEQHLNRFADGIAEQARKLSRKGYYAEYQGSAEITVMFVPGDQFVDAALSKRPDLLEVAAAQNVILASPSSLIALLRAVAVGFREARLAEEARELLELGRVLHERASVALEHVARLGRALDTAVKSFNSFVGSYESRLEPTLRQFEAAGVKSAKELPSLKQVAELPDALVLPEASETNAASNNGV